jgi:hypothetical protein
LLRKRSDRNKKIALKDKGPLIEPAPITIHYVVSRHTRRGAWPEAPPVLPSRRWAM